MLLCVYFFDNTNFDYNGDKEKGISYGQSKKRAIEYSNSYRWEEQKAARIVAKAAESAKLSVL